MQIVPITADNFSAVQKIYAEGLATGFATFETQVPNWEHWHTHHHSFARLAVQNQLSIIAWAALSPVSQRAVYSGVAEVSIYVAEAARGQSVGTFLLHELIRQSEANGIWTLQSSIFRTNVASLQLHERCGFRKLGFRERVAQRDGSWHDNVLLERRSAKVGL